MASRLGMLRNAGMGMALAVSATMALPQTAAAQSLADEADVNFDLGADAYRKRAYRQALSYFMASNRLSPNKRVVMNIGHTYAALEEYAEAYRWYQLAGELGTDEAAVKKAQGQIAGSIVLVDVTSTPPGADVYIGRKDLGRVAVTPATVALDPGVYDVIVTAKGYHDGIQEGIDLSVRGDRKAVVAELDAIVGTVTVSGAGGRVRLGAKDGPVVTEIPGEAQLPQGQQTLYFERPGFRSLPALIEVFEGKTVAVEPDFLPITGTIVVDADEQGALVEVDGKAVGYTPAVVPGVRVGDREVRVSKPGYEVVVQTVSLEEDQQLDLGRLELAPSYTVTAASRSAESAIDAPASVTLISAREIRAFGYQSLYQALGGVRGFFQTDDLTYSTVGVRGFGRNGDYGNRLLVTVDGHTMNDDQIGSSYVGEDFLSDLQDVQQIEVVRGPGSALYGSNAVFGVINLVMRDGQNENAPHVSMSAEGDTLRARTGAGVGDEDRGMWFSAGGLYSAGRNFVFSEFEGNERHKFGVADGVDEQGAATLSAKAWTGDLTVQGSVYGRQADIPTGSFETRLADTRATTDDYRGYLEGRYATEVGNADVDVRAYLDYYEFYGIFPYGPFYLYEDRYQGAWAGAEPRVTQHFGEVSDVTVGAEIRQYFLSNMVSRELPDLQGGNPYGTPLEEKPVHQVYSGYVVGDLHPNEVVRLNIGGRVDAYQNLVDNFVSFNPRAALVLSPGKEVFKVMAGTAFRAPSPYEYFYDDGGLSTVRPESLSPETIQTVEGEWNHAFDQVLSTTVAAYLNRIDALVDTEVVPGQGVFRYANVDEPVFTAGAEGEIRRTWKEGWMVGSQLSLQRTRVGSLGSDRKLSNSPEVLGTVMNAIPLANNLTLANKLRVESPRITLAGGRTGWTQLWDLTVTGDLAEPSASWGIGVRNLMDVQVDHPGGPDLQQDVLPQPGRQLYASVTASF